MSKSWNRRCAPTIPLGQVTVGGSCSSANYASEEGGIFKIHPNGDNLEKIISVPEPARPHSPVFSPDGAQIAWAQWDVSVVGPSHIIRVADADGSNVRTITIQADPDPAPVSRRGRKSTSVLHSCPLRRKPCWALSTLRTTLGSPVSMSASIACCVPHAERGVFIERLKSYSLAR